jgi:hypothetical protein
LSFRTCLFLGLFAKLSARLSAMPGQQMPGICFLLAHRGGGPLARRFLNPNMVTERQTTRPIPRLFWNEILRRNIVSRAGGQGWFV